MRRIREKIFNLVSVGDGVPIYGEIYDIFMIAVIIISLLPLIFKETTVFLSVVDRAAAVIFIADYVLRLSAADFLQNKKGPGAFFRYPFTPMAIIDLISILPSFVPIHGGFRLFRLFRLMRVLRIFRVAKLLRYSKNLYILVSVFKRQRDALSAVCVFAITYVLICALIIFNVEPQTFDNFFEAVYWAVISLSTVGYGDIYPVTSIGRGVTMLSSIIGIAVIALPAGVITAGYIAESEACRRDEESESSGPVI